MSGYLNQSVAELAKQLTAGLLRLRKGYVDCAEELLGIVEPQLEYPIEFVTYRITGYRPAVKQVSPPVSGETLCHDLGRLILDVCRSFDLKASAYPEPAYDVAALARRLRVSTKTVQRWRRRGLVARKLVFADGKKRVAFLESSLRNFARHRRRLILRSARFSLLDRQERADIIRQARRLSRGRHCLQEISRRLAARTGRAVETIRYTIRRHDAEHPDQAVFPRGQLTIDAQAREVIYRCFLHGVAVTSLAKRYGRSRGRIYHIVNEMRARQLLERKIEYMPNAAFDLPDAEQQILLSPPAPGPDAQARAIRAPKDLPPYLRSLYELPVLSAQQERRLFQEYNYLKYRADKLRKGLDPNLARSVQLRRIEQLLIQADALKNELVRSNLRLVVSIAKKHLHGPQTLFELISDGNMTLLKTIEKFDYDRGFKFSTYASWAIMKNFARSVPKEKYLLDQYVTGTDEMMELAGGLAHYDPKACSLSDLRDSLQVVLAQLAPRERTIIVHHFGLDESSPAQTLDQLSQNFGISKERVRQIERRAMEKLRAMLQPVQAELLA